MLEEVFTVVDRNWRGMGNLPDSGLGLRDCYADFDASRRYPKKENKALHDNGCISGLILQGKKKPCECPFFGNQCTPETPFGAPMVSNEGACAAYYHYSKPKKVQ